MRFAIYSRKSKYTGKGESVENQVQLCKEYIQRHYDDLALHQIEVFEDEGFSGKDLQRPEFMRMRSLVRKKAFDYVVCYRLDRISRNVSDFSTLIEEFARDKVSFICIKEQFDTSTPMGRAMMYIASVFAQLERETIAERIRDNMLMLARTGRWLGGNTPLGFESESVSKESIDGKEKTYFKLVPVASEQDTVSLIYRKYLELKSLSKLETFLVQNECKTRKNKYFTTVGLREILTNPVYCTADNSAYDFFTKHGSDVCCEKSSFDGKHGIAAYNRTTHESNSQIKNDMTQWIITTGKHKGIVRSSSWINVQRIIKTNMPKKYGGRVQNQASLLSGLLVCKNCGSFMRPRVNSNKRRDKDGNQTFAYLCELKKKSKSNNCEIPNINGNELDKIVCEEILKYDIEGSQINSKLLGLKNSLSSGGSLTQITLDAVRTQLREKRELVDDLIFTLAKSRNKEGNDVIYNHVNEKLKEIDKQITELSKEEFRLTQEIEASGNFENQVDVIYGALKNFSSFFFTASTQDKRAFLRSIIEKIEWDGRNIHIFLFGEQ